MKPVWEASILTIQGSSLLLHQALSLSSPSLCVHLRVLDNSVDYDSSVAVL